MFKISFEEVVKYGEPCYQEEAYIKHCIESRGIPIDRKLCFSDVSEFLDYYHVTWLLGSEGIEYARPDIVDLKENINRVVRQDMFERCPSIASFCRNPTRDLCGTLGNSVHAVMMHTLHPSAVCLALGKYLDNIRKLSYSRRNIALWKIMVEANNE